MLYDSYEKKIKRLRTFRNILMKYKVIIIAVVSFLLVLASTLLSINGVITKDIHLNDSVYVYGENLDYSQGQTIFNREQFLEYAMADSDDWSTNQPSELGNYKVRLVAKRTFGINSYGSTQYFSIVKNSVNISVGNQTVIYGEKPLYIADGLADGHAISNIDFAYEFDVASQYSANAQILEDSVRIVDKDGRDITKYYNITVGGQTIQYTKRKLQVRTGDVQTAYTGQPIFNKTFTFNAGTSTAFNDRVVIDQAAFFSESKPGLYHNTVTEGQIKVLDAKNADVSHRYDISYIAGQINILKRLVELKVKDNKVYDGTTLVHNDVLSVITPENLVQGHTLVYGGSLSYDGDGVSNQRKIKLSSESALKIHDELGKDVTENYTLNFDYQDCEITKREVTIQTQGKEFIYNGKAQYFTEFTEINADSLQNKGLLPTHVAKVIASTANATVTNFGDQAENVFEVAIYSSTGQNLTNNYEIDYAYGSLTVVKRELNLGQVNIEKIYDANGKYGIILSNEHNAQIVSGQSLSISGEISNSNVDRYVIAVNDLTQTSLEIYYLMQVENQPQKVDVLYNYDVKPFEIVFNVSKRDLIISTNSSEKIYDSTPLTCTLYGEKSGHENLTALAEGQQTYVTTSLDQIPSIVNYFDGENGTIANKFSVGVKNEQDEDVTQNYNVIYIAQGETLENTYGTLRIIRRELELQPAISLSKIYDGLDTYSIDYTNEIPGGTESGLIWQPENNPTEQHSATIKLQTSSPNVKFNGDGEIVGYEFTLSKDLSQNYLVIKNQSDVDLSSNYVLSQDSIQIVLVITKREIKVYTQTLNKTYDGLPLQSNGVDGVTQIESLQGLETPLANGEEIYIISPLPSITNYFDAELGTIINEFTVGVKKSADGSLTTANYDIDYEYGKLSIEKRRVDISDELLIRSRVYDTFTQFSFEITSNDIPSIEDKGLVAGHKITITASTSSSNVATYYVKIDASNLESFKITDGRDDLTGNYTFDQELNVVYDILQREIDLDLLIEDSKIYDGKTDFAFNVDQKITPTQPTQGYGLIEGHKFTLSVELACSDAGRYQDAFNFANSKFNLNATVFDSLVYVIEDQTDLTSNYKVIGTIEFDLTIEKRILNVEIKSASKIYDGLALTCDEYTLTSGHDGLNALADNQTEKISTALPSITNYYDAENGQIANDFRLDIYNELDQKVTKNYDIKYTDGTLTIIRREITIKTGSAEKVYDATPLTCLEYFIITGDLAKNQQTYIKADSVIPSIVNVGVIDNVLDVGVRWSIDDKKDESLNYIIKYRTNIEAQDDTFGKLEILPRKINVLTSSETYLYDGQEHSLPEYIISHDYGDLYQGIIQENGLVIGQNHKINPLTTPPTIIDAGTINNYFKIVIYSGDEYSSDTDVTSNYDINYVFGTLTVTPRKITITTESASKVYDGTPLSRPTPIITGENDPIFASGQYWDYKEGASIPSITNVYDAENGQMLNAIEIDILDGQGKVVTSNYEIKKEYGTLEVTPRKITITTESASKVYDGTPLSRPTPIITGENDPIFASGQHWEYREGVNVPSITNVYDAENGKMLNAIEIDVIDEQGKIVTGNYEIKKEYGTLEVTPREITVTTESASKMYDGLVLIKSTPVITGKHTPVLASGQHWDYKEGANVPSITNVYDAPNGKMINAIEIDILDEQGNVVTGNYKIETVYGTLEITPRKLVIKTGSDKKLYDGTPLTCKDFFIIGGNGTAENQQAYVAMTDDELPSIIAPGSIFNELVIGVKWVDGYGEQNDRITLNYIIEYRVDLADEVSTYGLLEIEANDIILPPTITVEKIYDGKATAQITFTDEDRPYPNLADGEKLTIDFSLSSANVGVYTGNQVKVVGIRIINADGEDVTDNYNIISSSEITVTVFERDIDIETAYDTKPYDGTPLTNHNFATSNLVEGHTVQVDVTGSQTEIGSSDNTLDKTSLVITDEAGNDVTFNYNLNKVTLGKLTVTEAPIPEKTYFTVEVNQAGVYYLKQLSYGQGFDGFYFESAPKYAFDSSSLNPQKYVASILDGSQLEMQIKNCRYFMIPYYTTSDYAYGDSDSRTLYSGTALVDVKTGYVLQFYSNDMLSDTPTSNLGVTDDEYYEFVLNNYLQVRWQTEEYLVKYIAQKGKSLDSWKTRFANGSLSEKQKVIKEIASFVQKSAKYEQTDYGTTEDMVVAFLEAGSGICRQFAYTGTLIYRLAGIPARYTEGFMVNIKEANVETQIDASIGHAWVEVYLENYGWVNVEVTAGSQGGGQDRDFGLNDGIVLDKIYDGYNQASFQFSAKEAFKNPGEQNGDIVKINVTAPSANAGTYTSADGLIMEVTVVDINGNDVTGTYDLTELLELPFTITQKEIKLTTYGAQKAYDGTPLVNANFEVAGLIRTHQAVVICTGSQTEIGSSENTYDKSQFKILDKDGQDVTENYILKDEVLGILSVGDGKIVIPKIDDTKDYDGNATGSKSYKLVQLTSFADPTAGEVLTINYTAPTADVGIYLTQDMVDIQVMVIDGNGNDVTSKYDISDEYDIKFTIEQRLVQIVTGSDKKFYDGLPLTSDNITVMGLVNGHTHNAVCTGSQTQVGVSENTYNSAEFIITDQRGNDVGRNYVVRELLGELEVVDNVLTIPGNEFTKIYDATSDYVYTVRVGEIKEANGLGDNDVITIVYNTSSANAGRYAGEQVTIASLGIKDENGNVVTSRYEIVHDGEIVINIDKREVDVTTFGAQKFYDGLPLTCTEFEVDNLLDGHVASVVCTGSQTEVGISDNTHDGGAFKVEDAGGVDVTQNYEIKSEKLGTLIVIDNSLVIPSKEFNKTYDATTQYKWEVKVSEIKGIDSFGASDLLVIVFNTSSANAGRYAGEEVTIVSLEVYDAKGEVVTGNYNITQPEETIINVDKRDVEIQTLGDIKLYDGLPLTRAEFEDLGLVDGHVANVVCVGSQTQVGSSENSYDTELFKILAPNGEDVTANYNVTDKFGELTVIDNTIEIKGAAIEKEYDGTPVAKSEFEISKFIQLNGLVSDDKVILTVTANASNVGQYLSQDIISIEYQILNAQGDDVTSKYNVVEPIELTVSVLARKIQVFTGSAERAYNGQPLTNDKFEVLNLIEGHQAIITCTGSQTEVGWSDNTYDQSNYVIEDQDGQDVTDNYVIANSTLGKLVVANVSVRFSNLTTTYDGNVKFSSSSTSVTADVARAYMDGKPIADDVTIEQFKFFIKLTDSFGNEVENAVDAGTYDVKLTVDPTCKYVINHPDDWQNVVSCENIVGKVKIAKANVNVMPKDKTFDMDGADSKTFEVSKFIGFGEIDNMLLEHKLSINNITLTVSKTAGTYTVLRNGEVDPTAQITIYGDRIEYEYAIKYEDIVFTRKDDNTVVDYANINLINSIPTAKITIYL